MKRAQIQQGHERGGKSVFDDLYEEISDHWQDKARKLQARRWRAVRRAERH